MKRLLTGMAVVLLVVSCLALPLAAAGYQSTASAWASAELRALYVQKEREISSDINPDFRGELPLYTIPEAGGVTATSTFNMRGFAMSPDGRFTYMSVLHGGGDIVRGMFIMETMTGKILAYDTRYDGDVCDGALPHFSYPKGVDADTRGYVYMGYTLSASYNATYLRIARQNEDGTLTHLSEVPVCSLGTPGESSGVKVGINGVSVARRDGRVYCYLVTNYEHDALYCFDVTDPAAPVLCGDFGEGGRMSLSVLGAYTVDEGLYLDVDADGNIYLSFTAEGGRGGVAIIAPDGKACRKILACDGAYSVELVGDFLLCGARTGGTITVLNRQTGRQVTTLSADDGYGERITRIQVVRDVLFVCDAGSVANSSNAVYAAPLSEEGQAFLDKVVEAQNRGYAEYETEAPETPPALTDTESEAVTTETPTDTMPETIGETLDEPLHEETDHVSPESASETTAAADGGCASASLLPVFFLTAGAAIRIRKKH